MLYTYWYVLDGVLEDLFLFWCQEEVLGGGKKICSGVFIRWASASSHDIAR